MATIAETAIGSPDFSILVSALQFVDAEVEGSDLVGTLSDPDADLTVFAPTDAAFGALAADLGFDGDTADTAAVTTDLTATVPAETLRDIITYHVSPGTQDAAAVAAADSIATVNGAAITPDLPTLADQEPDLLDPSLVATDIGADNGIIHAIDRVLLPVDLPDNDAPSITDIVASSGDGFDTDGGDFDVLLTAVTTAGLAETLADPDADLTAFAPTDAAFTGLAQALGFEGEDEGGAWDYLVDALTALSGGDPVGLLTTVLTYHVAPESLQASQVAATDTIATLAGPEIAVTADDNGIALGDLDLDVPDPAVALADVQAANGIVHAIDGVLLPADLLPAVNGEAAELAIGEAGQTLIETGAGADFTLAKADGTVTRTGAGDDVAVGGEGLDTISGGDGNDSLTGGLTNADLRDVIFGGAGDDTVDGGAGNDAIFGGTGDDVLRGGTGTDEIAGGTGNDQINGGALSDLIFGGDGDDFLNGGFGSDRMNGGDGADTFFHLGVADHGSDWIQDFSDTEGDTLLFGEAGATADQFQVNFATTGAAGSDDVEEAFVVYQPTGQIVWALVDGAALDTLTLGFAGSDDTVDLLA